MILQFPNNCIIINLNFIICFFLYIFHRQPLLLIRAACVLVRFFYGMLFPISASHFSSPSQDGFSFGRISVFSNTSGSISRMTAFPCFSSSRKYFRSVSLISFRFSIFFLCLLLFCFLFESKYQRTVFRAEKGGCLFR